MLLDVTESPYYLSSQAETSAIGAVIRNLTERVEVLRARGKLTEATLLEYYGAKRFEQIAESNALEGSTLSVGETAEAVLKGITITGHDPAYSRDAQSLSRALQELTVMARAKTPTDIEQMKHLHELILGERAGAGSLRTSEVRIRGSKHVPPRTWKEVMDKMEHWEHWSRSQATAPTILRATVLHAWLAHIHPFIDGNGRAARALTNLELIRAGYPPIIIRAKDRDRYLDALGRSDEGELGAFVDLIAGRMEDALRDLERAALKREGHDNQAEVRAGKIRRAQEGRLAVWNAGVHLLFENLKSTLTERFSDGDVELAMREYDELSVDDFIDLCEGRPVSQSWAFSLRCRAPGGPLIERLAWAGVMGTGLRSNPKLVREAGRPVLRWSLPNPAGYPPWSDAGAASPVGEQMTIHQDRWLVTQGKKVFEFAPSDLASRIASYLEENLVPESTL